MVERQCEPLLQPSPARPRISVCMAIYNGEHYFPEQMRSILPQLSPNDEVVIVDDGSTDATLDRIAAFNEPRILIAQHKKNEGVISSFEDAVRLASGDIIFFSDQDDIWAADKVEKMLVPFARDECISIVTSAYSVIDANGHPTVDATFSNRPPFTSGFFANLYINRFQGSAMAIRRTLLPHVLPFPKNCSFVHDEWIGLRNALLGGRVVHVPQPLLHYRRHGNNASKTRGLYGKIRKRMELLLALARYSGSQIEPLSDKFVLPR
ncbi:MAG: glycosyltransferase family 2 protein [Terracidiphilus sp.]